MVEAGEIQAILIAVALKEKEIKKEIEKIIGKDRIKVFSFKMKKFLIIRLIFLGSCNLSCSSCPHSINNHNTPRGSMELKLLEMCLIRY